MTNRIRQTILVVSLVLIWLVVLPVPAAASIPDPTSLQIQEVTVYENVRETGDQLYLVQYYIVCNTTYTARQLFIFRLFDEDDNELTFATPYPYNNDGFGVGIVGLYVDAAEAPTYESGVYVKVQGNPLADWSGDPPSTTMTIIDWNTGTTAEMQVAASGKVLGLASELTLYWGTEMTTVVQGVTVLTDYGAVYFTNVVPYLSDVAPYCLGQYVFDPDYPVEPKPATDDYATWLEEQTDGTIMDLGPVARAHGWDEGVIKSAIWYSAVVALFVALIQKDKLNKGTMLLFWPFVIAAPYVIGAPLYITVIAGFLVGIMNTWVFYKGST